MKTRDLALAALLAGGAGLAAPAPAADGKALFLAQKCNLCHSVQSAGIERTTQSEKLAGPDLTEIAAKLDPAWLAKYLKREEVLHDKKHPKAATLPEADLKALVAWVQQQKKK